MEYNWKGKNLKQWCLDNKLDYKAVYYKFVSGYLGFEDFMKRLEKQTKTSLKTGNIIRKKLKGKTIKEVCREKDLIYSTVMKKTYIYKGDVFRAMKEAEEIRMSSKKKNDNPCNCCMKRNCLGCPNYLYEEQDKQWKAEKYETTKKFD